jgi:nuclear transport factor 2 (NTF2) superfamily protein
MNKKRAVVTQFDADNRVGAVRFEDEWKDTITIESFRAYGNFAVGWHGWAYQVDGHWFWQGD